MADMPDIKFYERPKTAIQFGVLTGLRVVMPGLSPKAVSFLYTKRAE